jgi:polyisoprenoid-binding protein YceI
MSTTTDPQHTATTLPSAGTYTIDTAHTNVGFVARHLVATKVRGSFTEFEGTIVIGDTPEASSVSATVKAASILTNQEQRDEHLRSSDFLESATYPELTLVSKRVTPSGDGHFDLVADLTIHGITKEVVFDLEFLGEAPGLMPETTAIGFEATTTINRREFDVNFDRALENGSFVIGNKIDIELNVEAYRKH